MIIVIIDIPRPLYHHMVPFEESIIIVELVSPENINQTTLRESGFVISNEYSPAYLKETLVVDLPAMQHKNRKILLDININKTTSKSHVQMEDILESELKKPPKKTNKNPPNGGFFIVLDKQQ